MQSKPELDDAVEAAKLVQIGNLIRDNQILTACIVFILWQAGAIAEAMALLEVFVDGEKDILEER